MEEQFLVNERERREKDHDRHMLFVLIVIIHLYMVSR